MIVPFDDILPVEKNAFSRDLNKTVQPHNAGERHGRRDGTDHFMISFDHFRFFQIEQNDGPACAADAHGLIILVQYKYPALQHFPLFPGLKKYELKFTIIQYNKQVIFELNTGGENKKIDIENVLTIY
jgi:hypothetical protein